jgi:hypothetical protein
MGHYAAKELAEANILLSNTRVSHYKHIVEEVILDGRW